jgi:uncharacterized protein YxjI
LLTVVVAFCSPTNALEIIKIKGNRALIRLDGEKVSVGEPLDVIDANGRKVSVIRITSFNDTKALSKIESGSPMVRMKVTKRTGPLIKDKYNFRLNPLIFLGAVNGNFDFRISRDWTVGLQGAYLQAKLGPTGTFNSDFNITAYGIGARANWFFDGAFKDGYYLGPSLEYLAVNIKTSDAFGPANGSATGMMASCLVGYGWFWDEGFNIMLGGGYGTVLGASGITIKDSAGNQQTITANLSGLTFEISIGFAF